MILRRITSSAARPVLVSSSSFAGAGAGDVDGRVDALLGNLAREVQFHVAGTLELFVDDFIHLGPVSISAVAMMVRLPPSSTLRAAPKKRFGRAGVGITTGQHLAGRRDDGVVGTGQTGDGVSRMTTSFLCSTRRLAFSIDHFGDLDVTGRPARRRWSDHFALHHPLHLGHFFRTLVNQQDDQLAIRVVVRRCSGRCSAAAWSYRPWAVQR